MASDITRLQSAYNSGALNEAARATQKKENKETASKDSATSLEDSSHFSKELSDPFVKPSLQKSRQSTGNFRNTLWESLFGNRSESADEEQGPQNSIRKDGPAAAFNRQGEARERERSTPQFQPTSAGTSVARDLSSTVQDFQKAQYENAGFIPKREFHEADTLFKAQAADGAAQPQAAPNPKAAPPNNNNVPAPPNGNNGADNAQQMQQMMLQTMNQMMKMMEQIIGRNGNNPIVKF